MSKPMKHGKKWQIRWYDEHGKRRGEVYEDYQDAIFALKSHQAEVAEVRRGFKVRPPRDRSFDELCGRWMETRAQQKRNPNGDESIQRAHLKPAFDGFTLRQITAEQIAMFSAELSATRAPQTVKNILNLLGAMLRQAVEWGWLDAMPKIRKPKIRLFGVDYRWLRTEEEVKRFLAAAKEGDETRLFYNRVKRYAAAPVFPMYTTAVYTGMRAGELAALRWDDVNLDRRLITVQRSFHQRTKSGHVRHVPILDVLLPFIKAWKLESGAQRYVFPNQAGQMWDNAGRIFREYLHDTVARAGFPPKYINFHSLRHTFASHWVMNGGDLFRLQKILGHHDSMMTQRYAHLSPAVYETDWGRLGKADDFQKGTVIELAHAKD